MSVLRSLSSVIESCPTFAFCNSESHTNFLAGGAVLILIVLGSITVFLCIKKQENFDTGLSGAGDGAGSQNEEEEDDAMDVLLAVAASNQAYDSMIPVAPGEPTVNATARVTTED